MPKLTRRTLLQSTALAATPALTRKAGATSVLTVSWDRPRAAPGDTARIIVRGPAPTARVTLRPPTGPPTHHDLRLEAGRAELEVPLTPRPDAPGVYTWTAETAGATARLQVIANRFVFGL